jgi:predicted protein tyrosine phosphatase
MKCPMHKLPETITICGTLDLERFSNSDVDYVVSILDPDFVEPNVFRTFGKHKRLTLRFHDIVEEVPNLIAPQVHHISELLEFGRTIMAESGRHLLIHCFAGVCRSTAAAALLLAQEEPERTPADAVERMLQIAPHAWPNVRMIAIGDEILNYNNALVDAVESLYSRMYQLYPEFGRMMTSSI